MHYFLWDLACLQCGRDITVNGERVQLRTQAEHGPLLIPMGLRCEVCGGTPTPTGDVDRVTVQTPMPFGPEDMPRLGRPPKRRPGEQVCTGCHEWKHQNAFYRESDRARSPRPYCIRCLRRYSKDSKRPCARCGEMRTPGEFPVTTRNGAARTCVFCKRAYFREYDRKRGTGARDDSEAVA